MRSFSFGITTHAQPLTEEGRRNYDRIFSRQEAEGLSREIDEQQAATPGKLAGEMAAAEAEGFI